MRGSVFERRRGAGRGGLTRIWRCGLFVGAMAAMFLLYWSTTQARELPDIGEPSLQGMSYSEERRLGEVILADLRANLSLIDDVEVNDYLHSLGSQINAVQSAVRFDFHFLLVNNAAINAFATPGGVIAINSGLFTESAQEMELAGVLAHEIVHVDRRHLPRLLALTKQLSWLQTLAAVVSVMAAVYNADLARVGASLGVALPIERQLSYTRSFEREADRYGLDLMAEAGFDPRGMAGFFARLQKLKGADNAPPEYLLTHPLTAERLADAQARALAYRGDYRSDSRQFQFAKARLLALLAPRRYSTPRGDERTQLASYRRAVALLAYGNPGAADEILRPLHAKEPGDLPIGLAYMQVMLALGRTDDALAAGRTLKRLYPRHESLAYYRAKAMLAAADPRRALNELTDIARRRPIQSPLVYRLMAQAASEVGAVGLEHEFIGDYYAGSGRLHGAVDQYKLALKAPRSKRTARARVEEKKKRLEDLLQRMRRPR